MLDFRGGRLYSRKEERAHPLFWILCEAIGAWGELEGADIGPPSREHQECSRNILGINLSPLLPIVFSSYSWCLLLWDPCSVPFGAATQQVADL